MQSRRRSSAQSLSNVQWSMLNVQCCPAESLDIGHWTLNIRSERLVTKTLTEIATAGKDWRHENNERFRRGGAFDWGDRERAGSKHEHARLARQRRAGVRQNRDREGHP